MMIISRVNNYIKRNILKYKRLNQAKKLDIKFVEPNFVYKDSFNQNSVIIDVGCSYEADLSVYLIKRFNVKAYGVDPTFKHGMELKKLEEKYPKHFYYINKAVANENTTLTFYESLTNESGSIFEDHVNVIKDEVKTYDVEAVTISKLLDEINQPKVDLLKLDLEGAEYDLLYSINENDLKPFNQIFIEFHHHAVKKFSIKDTNTLVSKITSFGFNQFSIDDHNYIFYRNN